jgi:hypothetical protein
MATTAKTYGLIPVYHPTGQNHAGLYSILSTYAANIFKGDLVKMHTDGTINVGDGTSAALGVFAGCEYTDSTGRPVTSSYWPTGTTATNIKAYVYDDPQTVYKIGVSGNASGYVQTGIGQQANIADIGTGSTYTGLSASSVSAAIVAGGTAAQVRIIGFVDNEIYHATNNPFPELLVQINELQFAPNAVGV